jgi:hypothetical protein
VTAECEALAQPDQEVITVSATLARPPRTTRLARALGLDGNPLRRATDRALTWIRIGLLAAFLASGPLAAIGAGAASGSETGSAAPRQVC